MKTVTVKGKVYQVGAIYWARGEYLELVRVKNMGTGFLMAYPDKSAAFVGTDTLKTVDQELGTIIDAPIELEDGDMCAFEYQNTHCMGFYNKGTKTFVNFGETVCCLSEAVMIAPLVEK